VASIQVTDHDKFADRPGGKLKMQQLQTTVCTHSERKKIKVASLLTAFKDILLLAPFSIAIQIFQPVQSAHQHYGRWQIQALLVGRPGICISNTELSHIHSRINTAST